MGFYSDHILPRLIGCACSMGQVMKVRAGVVPQADGHVLEIGCGTGTNFSFYDPARVTRLTAIDPEAAMVRRAEAALSGSPIAAQTQIVQVGAEALPLSDKSIDTVVLTFVLCTIPDPDAALSELRRVLKPGGKVIYAEHGLSPDTGIARWQRRLEPIQRRIAGGCHLTRNPETLLANIGLRAPEPKQFYMPKSPKVLGYTFTGIASA